MTLRDIRTAARIVGRRNALRYLALGAGAALVSACTGKDKPAAPPTSPAASPSTPAPSSSPSATSSASPTAAASSGVVGRAFAEFVKGSWTIRSTLPGGGIGGRKDTGRAAIGADGRWTIVWSATAAGTWSGTWSLKRGRLDLQVLAGPRHLTEPDISTSSAEKVPDTVEGDLALNLRWYPMGAQDVFGRLEVAYNGTELRIRHFDMSGKMSIHMCTRT
ncbi:hypothetical protein MTF65_10750 [Streptomyces sp. APSN-46.1]|uniref:hypothetical protein n=1 Tax=Streptomyces sp. APSN-46.1 TaxID=2929049 RepID=UPI001FB4B7A8|nr:hypothetical protein [Streptomyces sp. APSN-46.1]MCJ1677812.1 hypothetical protein [Streptomyces sp. APSN-46.1]